MTAGEVVESFIRHLNAMELEAAWALLAPDIVYHNIPMQPVTGREAVRAVFAQIPMTAIEWIVHHQAERDHVVLNERTDRFRLADGRWVALRVMGTFEVADGRIAHWRDYFDLNQWLAQISPAEAPAAS